MLRIREAVVVEGKHDRIRLQTAVEAPIFQTNGFRIFKDKEQMALLRRLAATRGLVILTDSDKAGYLIREHLMKYIPPEQIKHAYGPLLPGKERRKAAPSKEGFLGVEGIDPEVLLQALLAAGVTVEGQEASPRPQWLTRTRLYEDGLMGRADSARRRAAMLGRLGLPDYLSTARFLETIPLLCTEEEYMTLLGGLPR